MMEDSDGNIHLKNLSLHPAANEEEGEWERREREWGGISVVLPSALLCFIQLWIGYFLETQIEWLLRYFL